MNNLLRLVGRRLIALPIMALGVTLLVFFLMSFTDPSIPARTVLGEGASPEAVEEYMDEHGMNDPWPVRYVDYIGGLFQGDLGTYGSRQTPGRDRHRLGAARSRCSSRSSACFWRRSSRSPSASYRRSTGTSGLTR